MITSRGWVVIVGGPLTVRTAEQFVELLEASFAVSVTVVLPRPTSVPATGDCVTVTAEQASDATIWLVKSGTAVSREGSAQMVRLVAQTVIVGLMVSTTVRTMGALVTQFAMLQET